MHGKPVHNYDHSVDAPRCGKGIYPEMVLTQDIVESRDPCRVANRSGGARGREQLSFLDERSSFRPRVQGYGIDLLAMKRQHLTAAWR